MKRKLTAILLALVLVVSLASCAGDAADTDNTPDENIANDADSGDDAREPAEPDGEANAKPALKVGFLKGPTGMGASYLMEQNEIGETLCDYDVTVEADVSNINNAIISGNMDLAAVPTNVASVLYNKTEGQVQIVAVNTLGVLYILENTASVEAENGMVNIVSDLAGKTVYATGQGANPQYVLEYVLSENGLTVGEDVQVEYLVADELATKMAAGEVSLCMLPVPNATAVMLQNANVRKALSLAEEWESVTGGDSVLTQGCIVARKDAVSDEALESFLTDYETSINYMKDETNIDDAAALAVKYGIVAAEGIAKAAIPECNMIFLTGADAMRETLAGYYEVLFSADPTSIGGSVPDDAFYR